MDDEQRFRLRQATDRALRHIDEAQGFLNDAARLAGNGQQFYQVTYDLDRAKTRAQQAAADAART